MNGFAATAIIALICMVAWQFTSDLREENTRLMMELQASQAAAEAAELQREVQRGLDEQQRQYTQSLEGGGSDALSDYVLDGSRRLWGE